MIVKITFTRGERIVARRLSRRPAPGLRTKRSEKQLEYRYARGNPYGI